MNCPCHKHWRRIAVSTVGLVMFVGLMGLWARSYWWKDGIGYFSPVRQKVFGLGSDRGGLWYLRSDLIELKRTPGMPQQESDWSVSNVSIDSTTLPPLRTMAQTTFGFGFGWYNKADTLRLFAPYWFPAALAAALATVPWLPWIPRQFSLRTLLAVTTLVAMGLGLGVYLLR